MYKRELTQKIERGLAHNAAVAILGPHQVGKTTLALEVAKTLLPSTLTLKALKIYKNWTTLFTTWSCMPTSS